MKLKLLLEEPENGKSAIGKSTVLVLMDKLKNVKGLQDIVLPTDKYFAIIKFAELLGIPENRFADFVNNPKIKSDE